jgi:hypothetical protein
MSNSTQNQNNSNSTHSEINTTLITMVVLVGLYIIYILIKLKIKKINEARGGIVMIRNEKWLNKSWRGKQITFPPIKNENIVKEITKGGIVRHDTAKTVKDEKEVNENKITIIINNYVWNPQDRIIN